jgi:hypothetical protein
MTALLGSSGWLAILRVSRATGLALKSWTKADISQIKAILSHVFVGADGWVDKALPEGASIDVVRYEEIFRVSEEDVYDFVQEFGIQLLGACAGSGNACHPRQLNRRFQLIDRLPLQAG